MATHLTRDQRLTLISKWKSLCVPTTSVTLCDLRVLVDKAADAVTSEDAR